MAGNPFGFLAKGVMIIYQSMESEFDKKLCVILTDSIVEPSGHSENFALKAGDTATIIFWHAREEYLKDHPQIKTVFIPDHALILPASSDNCGRLCYIRHWEIFPIKDKRSKILEGKSFCITGPLSHPREVYISIIQFCGGEYKTTVTKNLDYLICSSEKLGKTKIKTAKENGIKCISEKQFREDLLGLMVNGFCEL